MVRDCHLDRYVCGTDNHRIWNIPHIGTIIPEEGHHKRVDVLLDRISNCTEIMNALPARQKELEREQQRWAAEHEEKQRLASAERDRLRLNEQHERRQLHFTAIVQAPSPSSREEGILLASWSSSSHITPQRNNAAY